MRRREFLEVGGKGLLATALLPIQVQPAAGVVSRLAGELGRQIPVWMRAASVPGLGIAVVHDARVAWRRGFGVRDAASNAPVTDATIFEAASMSKPVFAYVVMKLCEAGVLNLDTPLTRYSSDRFLAGDSRLDQITARHVLSHTGGFQNWRSEKSPLAIHFTPGSQYLYSGEGYNYLQTIVTKLAGQPFEQYMRTRLFEPLGMTSSGYAWNDEIAKLMARPHDPDGRPITNNKSSAESVARYGSAGALLTTPDDYAKFLITVIDPKPADAYRLRQDTIREMLRPHVKVDAGEHRASWALGWQVFHNPGRDFIYHGGDNTGFHCAAVASVPGRSGFVAMTNGENGAKVLSSLLSADFMQEFLSK